MAAAYSDRIAGTRRDNLEQAIEHYQHALAIRTKTAYPEQWAATQNNLANAYSNRITGTRQDNLKQAIEHYQHALDIYTKTAYPEQWAQTQNNLAAAYRNRIAGARRDNIEQAIEHYQHALEIRTKTAYPEQWAGTQNNLANAYRDRIAGTRADNLQQARSHSEQALDWLHQQPVATFDAVMFLRTAFRIEQDWQTVTTNGSNCLAAANRILEQLLTTINELALLEPSLAYEQQVRAELADIISRWLLLQCAEGAPASASIKHILNTLQRARGVIFNHQRQWRTQNKEKLQQLNNAYKDWSITDRAGGQKTTGAHHPATAHRT